MAFARRGSGTPGGAEISLGETRTRMVLLAALGVLLGGVGGIAAFVVVRLVGLISNLALLHRVAFTLPDLGHYHPGPELIPVAVGGALVVALLALWSPVIKGHGIPESLEAIVVRESRIKPRAALAKPVSAAVAMGTGGPFGAEGPIIVTGASIGSLVGQVLPVSAAERRILLATGAAAGMAGVFDTPVAAVLIAFELLLFERSLRALLPLVLATGLAAELHTVLLGAHPLFAVSFPLTYTASELPLFCVVGIASGVLAIVLNKGLFAFEAGFRRLPVPDFFHPLIGAVGFAAVGLFVPGSLSVGYWAISDAVNGKFLLGAAATLMVAKLFSWWIALASGTSGGTLAPIFLIGATTGEMLGIGLAHLFPSMHASPGAFALVAMGASFGAAARAPLTGAVFAIEVTGADHLLVPMLIAVGLAEAVAELGLTERLMTDKLVRRGFRVEFDTEVDPFRTVVAGQAMGPVPEGEIAFGGPSVDRSSYLRDALAIFMAEPDVKNVVVTDKAKPIGVIARDTITEVLGRRIGESATQPPTLRWVLWTGGRLRTGLRSASRTRRFEAAHAVADADINAANRPPEDTTGRPSTTADGRPSTRRLAGRRRDSKETAMDRTIIGFHRDTEGDWAAELDCGHNQHVRHRPPFQIRPWIVDDAQRAEHLGTPLHCPLCERAEMPEGLRLAQTSPHWDQHSLPRGLRSAHVLATGTWGRLHLEEGDLSFRAATTPPIDHVLHAGAVQEIPPGIEHEIEPHGHVRLFIEFFHVVHDDTDEPDDRNRGETRTSEADVGGDPACYAHLFCPECASLLSDGHMAGCPQAAQQP